MSVDALVQGTQDALFSDLWAALSGSEPKQPSHRHLEELDHTLTIKHRSGPRLSSLPERSTPEQIRLVKKRYATVRGTYRAFIGAMGILVFVEALSAALARWVDRPVSRELLRGYDFITSEIWPSHDKFYSRSRPEAHYWHPAATQGPYGPYMDPTHRLAVAVIERSILIPKDRALFRLRNRSATRHLFVTYLVGLQSERVALRDWLQIHTHNEEGGAPSLSSWQESVAGLPSETVASTLHILHPWIDAAAEHGQLFDSLEELQICTLQNSRPLFHAPAGLTHQQLQWLLGRTPRPSRPVRSGLLRAVVSETGGVDAPKVRAVWDVGPEGPDMSLALSHPARCAGLLPIPFDRHARLEAIRDTYQAFMRQHVGLQGGEGWSPLTCVVDIAAFLSVLEMGILYPEIAARIPRLVPRFMEDRFPYATPPRRS